MRAVFLSVILLLVATPAAAAQEALDRATEGLRESPVYVDREASDILSEDDAEELRGRIEEQLTPSTLFVAVLPEMVGMTPEDAATELGNRVTVEGSIAVIVGDRFQMLGSTNQAADAGTAAYEEHGAEGAAPLLFAVVDELAALDGQRPAGGGAEQEDDGGIGPVPWILLGLVLAGGAAATILVTRRRRHDVRRGSRRSLSPAVSGASAGASRTAGGGGASRSPSSRAVSRAMRSQQRR